MTRWPMRSASRDKLADSTLGDKVHRATLHTLHNRARLVASIPEWGDLRQRAREARLRALDRHEELLDELTRQLDRRGIPLTVASTSAEACELITRLVLDAGGRVTKSKSMTSEEIGLNAALESAGAKVTETDLGELIVQLAGQAPSHVTAPAIHLSTEDIALIFRDKLGMSIPAWVTSRERPGESIRKALARELSLAARRVLRERFLEADVGISGANFLVAESGTIVLVENEGNIQLTTCLPKRHIVLAGIDKLVETEADLAVLLRLLPVSATAQRQSCYVSLFADAHPDMHVVLIDHGRRALMGDPEQRDLLTCIRCGACMNACPVYRNIGGHAYGGAYPGPIGSLLMPHLEGMSKWADLPFASSLCGACTEACPVQIPLHERLLQLRARAVNSGEVMELGLTLRAATAAMQSRTLMSLAGALYPLGAPMAALAPAGRAWLSSRTLPSRSSPTFRAWWKQHEPRVEAPQRPVDPTRPAPETAAPTPPTADLLERFARRLAELGPGGESELHRFSHAREAVEFLRKRMEGIDPAGILISGQASDKRGYELGVTPAAALIADTGGVVLDLPDRTLGRASTLVETHIVVASPSQIVATLADAIELRWRMRRSEAWSGYQVIVTGPSRTADVEKVLVIPAHGPRRLVVVLCEEQVDLAALRGAG